MRSKRSLLLAGMAAFVAVTIMALGCSDDDQPAPAAPVDNGIESLLSAVQTQVHQYLDSAVVTMYAGLKVATFVDTGSAEDVGNLFMGSGFPDSTRSGSWIVSYLTDLSSGAGTKSIVDSITYVVDGHFGVNARNAEAMYARHKFNFVSDDTTVTFTNLTNHGDLHITGIVGTTATINGAFDVTVRDKVVNDQSTLWNNWTIQVNATDLTFNRTSTAWTSGCPNSGTATVNVVWQQAQDDHIPTYTQWQMNITITDGQMAVDVTTGNLSSSYEHSLCTP